MNEIAKGKLVSYFESIGITKKAPRGWTVGDCPFCGKKNKFGVNYHQFRTNCFVCGVHHSPTKTIMELESLNTMPELHKFINVFEEATFLQPVDEIPIEKPIDLPESFRLLALGQGTFADLARKYMEARGFKVNELSMRGVGYCTKGPYIGRIILPFYERGTLIYFNARKFIDIGPKFKNPALDDFGIGKNLLLYNIDSLAIYNTIYIVESVTNALTLGNQAIALGGKVISQYQLSKILSSSVKNLVILLDPDAYDRALQLGMTLAHHKKVKVVRLPDGADVNDLGRKKTKALIKATPWATYPEIYKLYLKYLYEREKDAA